MVEMAASMRTIAGESIADERNDHAHTCPTPILIIARPTAAGAERGTSALLGLCFRLRHPRLPLPRQVRHNAEHPLDQHDLSAVMHLVLLDR